jgi:hypothetical protein
MINLLFVYIFSISNAMAADAGGLGFLPITDKSIPAAGITSSKSVFLLKVLAAGSDESLRIFDISGKKAAIMKMQLGILPSTIFDNMDKFVFEKQVERCEQEKDKRILKTCPITFEIRQSSGFLAGDGRTL